MRAAVYMTNEGVLRHRVGELVKDAYEAQSLEVAFDLEARGLTQRMLTELDRKDPKAARKAFRCWPRDDSSSPHRRQRYSFHPKVLTLGLRIPRVRGVLKLALIGSGNLTLGGMETNHELGVLSARVELDEGKRSSGWLEADAALEALLTQTRELRDGDELPIDARDQRRQQAIDGLDPWVLREDQHEAVEAVIRGWQQTKGTRRDEWKGGLVVLPPGTGKTVIAMESVRRLMDDEPMNRVVWLAPNPGLAEQAFKEWQRYHRPFTLRPRDFPRSSVAMAVAIGERLSIPDGELARSEQLAKLEAILGGAGERPTICFIGKDKADTAEKNGAAWGRRLKGWADLVVADEAHHAHGGRWRDILDWLSPRMVLGLTATAFYKNPDLERPENRHLLTGTRQTRPAFALGDSDWADTLANPRRASRNKARVLFGKSVTSFFEERKKQPPEQWVMSEPSFTVYSVKHDGRTVPLDCDGGGHPPHQHIEGWLTKDIDLGAASWRSAVAARANWAAAKEPAGKNRKRSLLNPAVLAAALTRIDRDVVDRAIAFGSNKVVLIFARNITHANFLHSEAKKRWPQDSNPGPVLVHSGEDGLSMQARELRDVRLRGRGIIVAVNVISEGIDLPELGVVIFPRWTTSDRLFWQMVGRGLRGPASGGTKQCSLFCYELDFPDPKEDPDDLSPTTRIANSLGPGVSCVREVLEVDATDVRTAQTALGSGRPASKNHAVKRNRVRGASPAAVKRWWVERHASAKKSGTYCTRKEAFDAARSWSAEYKKTYYVGKIGESKRLHKFQEWKRA